MNDFFYYSIIRAKKEDTTKTRKLDKQVPVNELPNLMRAMGYYPTEQEVKNIIDEVKYS
jgi:Ca2+-binding EF-hand superfamily protein